MTNPALIFGTGLLGMSGFVTVNDTEQLISELKGLGIKRFDTAARYPPIQAGLSEQLLGEAGASVEGFQLDSKVLMGSNDGRGELSAAAIDQSVQTSLARLHCNQLDTLYCHRSDPQTSLEETIAEFDRQVRLGTIKQWGICRFSRAQVESILRICELHSYVKPGVYQGEYNLVTRGMESELLPLLRSHGIRYHAHRSLAAGFLSGRFTAGKSEGTRFGTQFPLHGVFRSLYDIDDLHEVVRRLEASLEVHGIVPSEAALRWIVFHSALRPGDGVIVGCTSIEQVRHNAESVQRGPLPERLARFMSELWDDLKSGERKNVL